MIKKISIILLITFVFITGSYIYVTKIREEKIIELGDIVQSDINIDVYDEYFYKDLIDVEGYEIINNEIFNTDKIGKYEIELFLLNEEGKKCRGHMYYNVVDNESPIILGGSSKYITVGTEIELEHSFLSADNYDSSPTREIIGDYDINTVGNYSLTLKVTDSSNNVTTNDFTLYVYKPSSSTSTSTSKPTYTYFEDVIDTYKTDNNKIGLDVSKWQGTIDYDKLKEANVEFVMIRVGYQKGYNGENVIDPYFINNVKGLNEVGIDVGIYFYSYATSVEEAELQAKWVVEQIKDYDIDLPVAFDFESWSSFSKQSLSLHDINSISKTFMDTINDNEYIGINYSSKYYLENIWDLDSYPTWLAHYTTNTDYKGDYIMWQLCSNGIVDGIDGNVDIDIMYN